MAEANLGIRITAENLARAAFREMGQDVDSLEGKLSAFSDHMVAMGSRLTAGITLPLVGIGAAAIKVAGDYEQSMNMFQAVSGATADQMAEVSQRAKELGADMSLPATSAADAGKAMTELAKAGLSVNDVLGAAKGTLQLAAAGALSEAEAAEIAANALNAFHLSGDKASEVANMLAATAIASSVEVKDMADSFKMASAVFSSFQGPVVGAEDAMIDLSTAIGILGNAGIKGSDAGTSLKQMLLQLTGPSDKAKDSMVALGLAAAMGGANIELLQEAAMGSKKGREKALAELWRQAGEAGVAIDQLGDIAYTSAGQMRPLHEIVDLVTEGTKGMTDELKHYMLTEVFGADATRAILALMYAQSAEAKELGRDWDTMREAVTRGTAAQDLAEARMKGFNGALEGLKSQLETVALQLAEPFLGFLNDMVRGLADAVAGLGSMDPQLRNAAIAFGLVMAAVGPLLLALGGLAAAAAFLVTPMGLVVVSMAGLAAASAGLGVTLDDIGAAFDHLGATVHNLLPALAGIVTAVTGLGALWVAQNASMIVFTAQYELYFARMALVTVGTNALAVAQGALNLVMSANPVGLVVVAIAALVAVLVTAYNTNEDFRNSVDAAWAGMREAAEVIFPAIGHAIDDFIDALGDVIVASVNLARDVGAAFDAFGTMVHDTFQAAVDAIQETWGRVPEDIREDLDKIVQNLQQRGATIVSTVRDTWDDVTSAIGRAMSNIGTVVRTAWDTITSSIQTAITNITQVITTAWNGVAEAVSTAMTNVATVVSNAWTGIATSITNALTGILATIEGWRTQIQATLVGLAEDAKAAARQVGEAIVQGITEGATGLAGRLGQAMGDVVRSGLQAAKDALEIRSPSQVAMREIGIPFVEGIIEGIESEEDDLIGVIGTGIIGPLRDLQETAGVIGRGVISGIVEPFKAGVGQMAREARGSVDAIKTAWGELANYQSGIVGSQFPPGHYPTGGGSTGQNPPPGNSGPGFIQNPPVGPALPGGGQIITPGPPPGPTPEMASAGLQSLIGVLMEAGRMDLSSQVTGASASYMWADYLASGMFPNSPDWGALGAAVGQRMLAGSIPPLAAGGIVTRPTLALIGEAGPEAVVPLSRGRGMGEQHVHLHFEGPVYGIIEFERRIRSIVTDAAKNGAFRDVLAPA